MEPSKYRPLLLPAAAGFILGQQYPVPGTRKRIDSLKSGAKDGLKLMIGLVPVFIVAAFLEGYVTRYSAMPQWLSITILALSFNFILWYFVLYPIRLEKRIVQTKSL